MLPAAVDALSDDSCGSYLSSSPDAIRTKGTPGSKISSLGEEIVGAKDRIPSHSRQGISHLHFRALKMGHSGPPIVSPFCIFMNSFVTLSNLSTPRTGQSRSVPRFWTIPLTFWIRVRTRCPTTLLTSAWRSCMSPIETTGNTAVSDERLEPLESERARCEMLQLS